MHYDVVIVGAGPAGSACAYYLSVHGVKVLLLDRETFPREKVCGDGVAPRAVRSLYKMGLQKRLDGHFNKFHSFLFAGAGKSVVYNPIPPTPRFPDHGYIIRRYDLDGILLDHARKNGADVLEGCDVKAPLIEGERVVGVSAEYQGKHMEITACVVVGADGARSTLGTSLGLLSNDPRYIGVSIRQYFEGVEDIGDCLEVYPEHVISPGSGWIFPLGEGVANVGVGAMLYHIKQKNINLREYLDRFINESSHASRKLKNAKPISPLKGAILRVGLGGSKVECPGLILVGDAASMTNPVSGEGITYAIETGEMAAQHILESRMSGRGFHHDPAEDSFRDKLIAKYGNYFSKGWRCIRWGNRPVFMKPLLYVMSKSRKRREYMVRALMYLRH